VAASVALKDREGSQARVHMARDMRLLGSRQASDSAKPRQRQFFHLEGVLKL